MIIRKNSEFAKKFSGKFFSGSFYAKKIFFQKKIPAGEIIQARSIEEPGCRDPDQ